MQVVLHIPWVAVLPSAERQLIGLLSGVGMAVLTWPPTQSRLVGLWRGQLLELLQYCQ